MLLPGVTVVVDAKGKAPGALAAGATPGDGAPATCGEYNARDTISFQLKEVMMLSWYGIQACSDI